MPRTHRKICKLCKTDKLAVDGNAMCWRCKNTYLDFTFSKYSPLKPYEIAQNFADHLLTESGERVYRKH